jgi:hypothetical protein
MKRLMTAILLTMLARCSYAQETSTCYNQDSETTICEFADGGATVTYFNAETKYYSKTSYTAKEWKDSLYHKSLLNPPKPEVKSPATTSKPEVKPPATTTQAVPAYTGPKTKSECKAAGYKWHKGACNGVKMPE